MAASKNSWKETNHRFINPYNFIKLGGDVQRKEPEKGNLTGKISCTLTVKTPLAIPDAESASNDPVTKEHKIYEFFRVNSIETIPGSQLKGMVRSYYEAVSNSCLSVNNNNIMSARHNAIRKPGLIQFKENEWILYKADSKKDKNWKNNRRKLEENARLRNWHSLIKEYVYDKNGNMLYNDNGKPKEKKVDKPNHKIFIKDKVVVQCDDLEKAVKDYNLCIEIYKENKGYFKDHESELTYGIRKDGDLYPVFYEIVNDGEKKRVYLSPSQISRSVFANRIDDILGEHKSCSKSDGKRLCKACALFGIISTETNGKSNASKVRFSDATVIEGTFSSKKNVTLKELSSPKTTSSEFYIKKPENAKYWNYDYKVTEYKDPNADNPKPIRELCDVELNGRKFYVHNPKLRKEDYHTNEKTNRNNSVELCNEKTQFLFDVYFENISDTQLKELVWTLTLGENSADSDRMFKLGHGKPLGLGSVKVTVNKVETREFDCEALTYSIKETAPAELISENPFDNDSDYFKEFMAMVNFRTLEATLSKADTAISYPLADDRKNKPNSKAHHQWFIANRSSGNGGTSTAWSIKYQLPKITDSDLSLPEYEKSGEQKNEKRRSKGKSYNDMPKSYQFGNSGTGGFMSNVKKRKVKNKNQNGSGLIL